MRSAMAEMHVLSKLIHPNIATLFGATMHQGLYIIGMEHCRHGDLRSCMSKKRLRAEDALSNELSHNIFDALSYIEAQGQNHRDVKTSNVLLTCTCTGPITPGCQCLATMGKKVIAKLCDFGLSKPDVFSNESRGNLAGTLRYIAPERVARKKFSKSGSPRSLISESDDDI